MRTKKLKVFGYLIIAIVVIISLFGVFLGLKNILIIASSDFNGIKADAKIIEKFDNLSCLYSKYSLDHQCSDIVVSYYADGKEYRLEDRVYSDTILQNKTSVIYNDSFPAISYIETNKGNMIFDSLLYLIGGIFILSIIYRELRRLAKKQKK